MSYEDIYKDFKSKTIIDESLIRDYRPCSILYDVPTIPNAIIVWLKSGQKIIYIEKDVA